MFYDSTVGDRDFADSIKYTLEDINKALIERNKLLKIEIIKKHNLSRDELKKLLKDL